MADKVHIPQQAPGPTSEPASREGAPQFGLTAAMALIVGSIIGVGVFNLPTSLAAYGPIRLVSMEARDWVCGHIRVLILTGSPACPTT